MAEGERNTVKKHAKRSRAWTETELKYFAIVLPDDEQEFAYKLDTLALKKTANRSIFEEVLRAFKDIISTEDFTAENNLKSKKDLVPLEIDVEKLRNKFKWLKDKWRRYTDRVKRGSGKAPIEEPEWYTIINSVFSDTNGNIEPVTNADELFPVECDDSDGSEYADQTECSDKSDSFQDSSTFGEDEYESDVTQPTEAKRKSKERHLEAKPFKPKKRVRTQCQAIQEMAKSFSTLGETQQKRSELFLQAENKRQAEFIAFQKDQTELNRQHELKILEVIMKYSHTPTHGFQQPGMSVHSPVTPHSPQYFGLTPSGHTPPFQQGHACVSTNSHILDLDNQYDESTARWH